MTSEAREAAAHWGGADPLSLIVERENAVYEAVFPFGRAALRLHRPGYQTEAAIRSELWWCAALAETGAAVPSAIPAQDGELLHRLSSGRFASVIEWVEGPAMGRAGVPLAGDRSAQIATMAALGATLADFHAQTDALTLPDWFERPSWGIEDLVGETPFWGRFWEHPVLDVEGRATLQAARGLLRERLSDHAAAGGDYGLIHADVLRENVVVSSQGMRLIDFDDSGFGFRAYDLGTVLSQALYEPHLPDLARALADGYGRKRPFDATMVPVMTLARCCASVGWTMPRLRADDPVHKSHAARAVGLAQKLLEDRVDWWA